MIFFLVTFLYISSGRMKVKPVDLMGYPFFGVNISSLKILELLRL